MSLCKSLDTIENTFSDKSLLALVKSLRKNEILDKEVVGELLLKLLEQKQKVSLMSSVVLSGSTKSKACTWDAMSAQGVPLLKDGVYSVIIGVKACQNVTWHFDVQGGGILFSASFWEHGCRGYVPCKFGYSCDEEKHIGAFCPAMVDGMLKLQWRNNTELNTFISYHIDTNGKSKKGPILPENKNVAEQKKLTRHISKISSMDINDSDCELFAAFGIGYDTNTSELEIARNSLRHMDLTNVDADDYKML